MRVDITGKKYGRLTVIEFVGKNKHRAALWLCKCECGNTIIAHGASLRSGNTRSCGCLMREYSRKLNYKHGISQTRIQNIYNGLKARCYNKNNPRYKSYGYRGVQICDEWLKSVKNFYDWAMSNGYKDDLTIDRIDNNGDYCPENCRWVNLQEQNRNTSRNRLFTMNGKTQCVTDWAKVLGLNPVTVLGRINRGKWSVEKALTTPVKHR